MGKNRKSGGSPTGSTEPIDYTDSNNEILTKILDQNHDDILYDDVYRNMQLLTEYCNRNGLELIDTSYDTGRKNLFDDLHQSPDGLIALSVLDHETGRVFNFSWDSLGNRENPYEIPYAQFTPDHIVENFDSTVKEFRKIIDSTNTDFNKNVKVVNFVYRNSLGFCNPGYSNAIMISPKNFSALGGRTGIAGTMIHEMAHNWEYSKYGEYGALKEFADMSNYPCTYAGRVYDDGSKPECLATTIEMAYTHKLRRDALNKEGGRIMSPFNVPEGKKMQDVTDDEWFEIWAKEWDIPVSEAEAIYLKN